MNTNYAGFWLRFVALIIDTIIIGMVQFIIITPILGVLGLGMAQDMQNFNMEDQQQVMGMMAAIIAASGMMWLISFVVTLLYHSLMEASKFQGSVGKIALSLKVTDMNGTKLDLGKAIVRNLCKIISSAILLIGYLMAGFTEKKQGLHDMIAGTLVVKK